MAVRVDTRIDHYSLLATIEDGFGLPRIANAKGAATLFDLLPDFAEKRDAIHQAETGSAAECLSRSRRLLAFVLGHGAPDGRVRLQDLHKILELVRRR